MTTAIFHALNWNLDSKKIIDYWPSVRAYVAAETHNWNLRVCNPRVISDRLVPNSFVWQTARLFFLRLRIDIDLSIKMVLLLDD